MTEEGEITIPIRVIRSFPHRNIRNLVLKNISTFETTESFLELILKGKATRILHLLTSITNQFDPNPIMDHSVLIKMLDGLRPENQDQNVL